VLQIKWTKSTRSFSNSNCVELAHLPGGHLGVRNASHPRPHAPVQPGGALGGYIKRVTAVVAIAMRKTMTGDRPNRSAMAPAPTPASVCQSAV
jgi:Domain of unknown function (DUF397)